jgi:hypothetical protein
MTDLALPKSARPSRPSLGVLMGGWKCYVNPATVALLEVWNVGNAFQVMATLGVTDRDGAPIRRPVSEPFESEDAAGAEMDRIAGSLFAVASPILRPAPDPGPVL